MAKKRNDGRMQKYFTYNGKRYYVYATTVRELDKKVYEKIQELENKKQDHDDPTLNLFYEKWTENRRDSIKESTLRCQHFQYNTCAAVVVNGKKLGEYRLSEIKADDIRTV